MTKAKLTISIDEEIAKDLRTRSIEKYGNSRSFSQLIEDMAAPVRFSADEPTAEEIDEIIAEFPPCCSAAGCEPPSELYTCDSCEWHFTAEHPRFLPPRFCPLCGSQSIRETNMYEITHGLDERAAARRLWKARH